MALKRLLHLNSSNEKTCRSQKKITSSILRHWESNKK